MINYIKYKISWWIAQHLPRRVQLYAYVNVQAVGEVHWGYDTIYPLFAERYGIKE